MEADELLRCYEVPQHEGVFVLGCGATRITVWDQQVRALNLVDALVKAGRLRTRDYLSVVGAGFGGLTVAVAAASVGARVRVVDERSFPLGLQRGCGHRWLHPHIYDWPANGSSTPQAQVLFLDWSAASAERVVADIAQRWESWVHGKSIQESPDTVVEGIGGTSGAWVLETRPARPKIQAERCKLVVLAVGFGLEKRIGPRRTALYWDRDNLHRFPLDGGEVERFLIAGSGDGALIDTVRAKIEGFQHDRVLEEFRLMTEEMKLTRDRIAEIESQARREEDPGEFLRVEYGRLRGTGPVDEVLKRRANRRAHVVLATRSPHFHSLKSTALNRFLVSRLVALGLVEHRQGELTKVADGTPVVAELGREEPLEPFYEVYARVGPAPALEQHFPSIAELCSSRLPRPDPDPTRVPSDWSALRVEPLSTTTVPAPASSSTTAYCPASCVEAAEIRREGVSAIPSHQRRPFVEGCPPVLWLHVDRTRAWAVALNLFGSERACVVKMNVLEPTPADPSVPDSHAVRPVRHETIRDVEFLLVEDLKYVRVGDATPEEGGSP